jgi:MoaA/NifB/PqqE/SkfB family radical SAM enzyme
MAMNWGQLSATLTMNSFSNKIPLSGQFELTTRCNLGCRMCYACNGLLHSDLKKKELSAKEWIDIAREARDSGMLFLLLTGGEVFFRDDFKEIYEELTRMGFIISIYTNGTLITAKVIKWLKTIPPSQIDISLYGASADTYRKVCGNAKGFSQALAGIRLIQEAGINLQLRTTIIKENRSDLPAIRNLAEGFGLKLNLVDYITPERERREIDTGRLSPAEQAQLILDTQPETGEEAYDETIHIDKEAYIKATECFDYFKSSNAFPCNSGKNSFFITWEGVMVPCSIMNTPKTHPLKSSFRRAWRELVQKCDKVPVCKTCSKCSLKGQCKSCPGRLLNETGSFKEPAPYLCELARENNRLTEYHKMEEIV